VRGGAVAPALPQLSLNSIRIYNSIIVILIIKKHLAFIALILISIGFFIAALLLVENINLNSGSIPVVITSKNVTPTKAKEATFVIGGDMMFDRVVSAKFPKDQLVDSVSNLGQEIFGSKDVSIVNLEGPIAETYSPANTSADNMSFKFPPKTVEVLKWLNLNAVSLANNHSLNGTAAMLENTKKVLQDVGITPIGDQTHAGEATFGEALKIDIITIDILGDHSDITETIRQAKARGDFVLVFPHWGNEYQTKHAGSQEELAKLWIDAGADLIIGSHPHVVQDAQLYAGKPIFYSLGNLIFDQTFSAATQRGLIISGKISTDKLILTLMPTIQKSLKPELMEGEERDAIVNQFKEELGVSGGDSGNIQTMEFQR
jgi:poly-gamma-glutamate capsule biosynthesis protein CapA/YwtB (metallophosphatase superfamily)